MKEYKVRSVKFTVTFSFDDKYDNCANATDDEIIEEAERQFGYALDFGDLSFNDFEEDFVIEEYYDLDEESEGK